jgi:arylsulfatase A-like enzyme
VVGLDPGDPIQVSYEQPVGDEPTGKDHPELLKMHPSHGHDQTIVNGISRIGYMSGGKAARWVDETIADTITGKAVAFIERHKTEPFFLYFSTHDIHVPRVPHPRFAGTSGLGPRGDAIVQLDWCVGEVLRTLDQLALEENTILIFTSDNGPVVDDGYEDQAVELLDGHKPAGPLRGGKYSAFDAGTRVPFLVRWPGQVQPGVSEALLCQIDLLSSMAALTGQRLDWQAGPDSFDVSAALLGKSQAGRDHLVEHAGTLSLIRGDWKYIEPSTGARFNANTNTELGNDPQAQLYNLRDDLGEKQNLAAQRPEIVKEMAVMLAKIMSDGRSRAP